MTDHPLTYGPMSTPPAAVPAAPRPEADPLAASITEERAEQTGAPLTTFEFDGETYKVHRKPPTLLLAELARTNSGDPEAVGVLAEFFEVVMGKDEYRRFRSAFYAADVEDDDEVLSDLMAEVIEKTLGRPTE